MLMEKIKRVMVVSTCVAVFVAISALTIGCAPEEPEMPDPGDAPQEQPVAPDPDGI